LVDIGLVGAGSWGTALSILLAEKKHKVDLWVRRSQLLEEIEQEGENKTYLPGIKIPSLVQPTMDLEKAVRGKQVVVICVPTRAVREITKMIIGYLEPGAIVLSATKGIDTQTRHSPSEIISSLLPKGSRQKIAVLSGPNHAEEVSRKVPTATVIASQEKEVAEYLQEVFTTSYFRAYTNPDIKGVELAGALKNVIAIAVGISDGLGFGDNTRATLITRGLVEIARLGTAMGARVETFNGLAGLGDLVATCTSKHSRNRYVGEELGRGRSLKEIVAGMKMVAEGIDTSRAVYHMSGENKLDMPICKEVYRILFEGKTPASGVETLMDRARTKEFRSQAFPS